MSERDGEGWGKGDVGKGWDGGKGGSYVGLFFPVSMSRYFNLFSSF